MRVPSSISCPVGMWRVEGGGGVGVIKLGGERGCEVGWIREVSV